MLEESAAVVPFAEAVCPGEIVINAEESSLVPVPTPSRSAVQNVRDQVVVCLFVRFKSCFLSSRANARQHENGRLCFECCSACQDVPHSVSVGSTKLWHEATNGNMCYFFARQAFYHRNMWRQRQTGGHSDTGGWAVLVARGCRDPVEVSSDC